MTDDGASRPSYPNRLTDLVTYRRVDDRDLLPRSPAPHDHREVRIGAQRHEIIVWCERDRQITAVASTNALADSRHRGIREDEDSRVQRSLGEGENRRGHVTGYTASTITGRIIPTPVQRLLSLDDVKEHDVQAGAPGEHVPADPNYLFDSAAAYPTG